MQVWMRVVATALCLPSLALNGFLGFALAAGAMGAYRGDSSGMGLMGFILLMVAVQAAFAVVSAWRKTLGTAARGALYALSIGVGFWAVVYCMGPAVGVPEYVKPLNVAVLLAAAGAGFAVGKFAQAVGIPSSHEGSQNIG